jgi:hypothetical protein
MPVLLYMVVTSETACMVLEWFWTLVLMATVADDELTMGVVTNDPQ